MHTDTWIDDQREDHSDPKRLHQWNRPNQVNTHKVSTNDVENTDSTNKRGDLLPIDKLWNIPWGTERMPKRTRGTGELLYIDQHTHSESKTRKKNLTMALIDYKKPYDIVPQG